LIESLEKKEFCYICQDRLINNDDKAWFKANITKQLKNFDLTWDFLFSKTERLIFGDFLVPGLEPRIYEQVSSAWPTAKSVTFYFLSRYIEPVFNGLIYNCL